MLLAVFMLVLMVGLLQPIFSEDEELALPAPAPKALRNASS